MRLTGAALVTAAGLLIGLLQARRLRDRAERRAELCRMLDGMEFELARFRTPMPALFALLSERLAGDAAALCRDIADGFAAGDGRDMAALWADGIGTLPGPERRILASLGPVLGRYGAEEQLRALESCARDMERARDEAREELRERGRLWVGLSAAGGAALAVLLL